VDLADDVRTIVLVLEEAYEILKDAARRERYRRAIETAPDDGTASGARV
jgi:DnaJ-class molecular chaperone